MFQATVFVLNRDGILRKARNRLPPCGAPSLPTSRRPRQRYESDAEPKHRLRFDWMRRGVETMIRKLAAGKYRLYSRKKNPQTGKRRNLGTFSSKKAAQQHEREIQFFKRH